MPDLESLSRAELIALLIEQQQVIDRLRKEMEELRRRGKRQAAPFSKMRGTFARVSTLLMTVGRPNKPDCTGKGGRSRGSARLPSIDSKSADSSPQIYAPAPT